MHNGFYRFLHIAERLHAKVHFRREELFCYYPGTGFPISRIPLLFFVSHSPEDHQ
jgi:hypothetical protein